MEERILAVDDDAIIVSLISDYLQKRGYSVLKTSNSAEAPGLFASFSPDLCLIDFNMPGKTGADLLGEFKAMDPTVEVVFLTGAAETRLATDLLRKGAFDYLLKPVGLDLLETCVGRALEHRRLLRENTAYRLELENLVLERTTALNEALRNIANLHSATLQALGLAMDFRDQSTGGHCLRVAGWTAGVAKRLGIREPHLSQIEQGAFLHDIGKLRIPDSILLKPDKLDADEWAMMRYHTYFGREFLAEIDFLQPAAEIVYSHHERFDGNGYPRGLRGDEIPLGARIFAIVDTVDACATAGRTTRRSPFKLLPQKFIGAPGVNSMPL